MKQKIKVLQKEVYGRTLFYPRNEAAGEVCKLAQKKTLSRIDLQILRTLGHEIEQALSFEEAPKAGADD